MQQVHTGGTAQRLEPDADTDAEKNANRTSKVVCAIRLISMINDHLPLAGIHKRCTAALQRLSKHTAAQRANCCACSGSGCCCRLATDFNKLLVSTPSALFSVLPATCSCIISQLTRRTALQEYSELAHSCICPQLHKSTRGGTPFIPALQCHQLHQSRLSSA
jgi:hypothetical protein